MLKMMRIAMWMLTLWTGAACAEFSAPKHETIDSKALGQKRDIDVYLPADFDKSPDRRYETIYVLDGDWNAKIVTQIVEFLQSTGFMPAVIVVSVPNFFDDKGTNSRDHDLTPTVISARDRSGGAPDFLRFLKDELLPFVNAHYPSNGIALVHGHSLGGMFLTYVLATDPNVFDGYIVLDPAMWWDEKSMAKLLATKIANTPTQGKAIFIAGREGRAFKGMGVDALQPVFANAPKSLHWQIAAYSDETHDSMKLKGTFDALKFAYRGYDEHGMYIVPQDAIVERGHPLMVQVNSDRYDYRYSTDGTEPTTSSPKVDGSIAVSDPNAFRLREFSTRGHFDSSIALHYQYGDAIAPTHAVTGKENADIHFAYYSAAAWPEFHGKPFRTGGAKMPDIDHVQPEKLAAILERDYVIPADGYYVIGFSASDSARLSIGDRKLIEIDPKVEPMGVNMAVPLRAGVYHIRVAFRRESMHMNLNVHVLQFDADDNGWSHELQ